MLKSIDLNINSKHILLTDEVAQKPNTPQDSIFSTIMKEKFIYIIYMQLEIYVYINAIQR